MKKNIFGIIAIAFLSILFSCDKKEEELTSPTNEDVYYVKYEISGRVYFYIDGVSYKTENGFQSQSFSAAKSFEETCGPVKKGFSAQIKITQKRGEPSSEQQKYMLVKTMAHLQLKQQEKNQLVIL